MNLLNFLNVLVILKNLLKVIKGKTTFSKIKDNLLYKILNIQNYFKN